MGWLTRDFVCGCGIRFDALIRTEEGQAPAETHTCPECGATAQYAPAFGSSMKVALPDGNRRFQGVREQRALQKEARRAKRSKDPETLKKALQEQVKTGLKTPLS